ncbi:hypothetical protein MAR_001019 [Mya arenaria]|uniref:Uncharacterized protein n=2 Tax=Mya arenaria TaxID=6604 RepID=A0ABY7FIV4_MYAAR|nr:hypothetical protein MAR_001019 [Mya arenaria]
MKRAWKCLISLLEKPESEIPRTVFYQILVKTRSFRLLQLLLADICVEDIVFIKMYKALLNLETNLNKMENALVRFGAIPEEFRERRSQVNKAVISTSIGGVVGSVLGIVGMALTPVTFGTSLGLTITGGVIGGVSGFTQAGFRIHEAVKQNGSTSDMNNEWEAINTNLNESIEEVEELFNVNKRTNDFEYVVPGKNQRGFISLGNVARSLHGGVGIGIAAAKAAVSTATIVASILGPIGIILDIGFLAEASYNKYNGNQSNAAEIIECLLLNESILLTCYRGNTEANGQIVEGSFKKPS